MVISILPVREDLAKKISRERIIVPSSDRWLFLNNNFIKKKKVIKDEIPKIRESILIVSISDPKESVKKLNA